MNTNVIISIRDLVKVYRVGETSVPALRGISLEVQRNEFVAIMGPSGSGKSTLMNLIGCLDRPTQGHYRLVGEPVDEMDARQLAVIRNRHIGFVFQTFNLLPRATALKNVALPLVYAGVGREEREERAFAVLAQVGLANRVYHRPSQLSGGQLQRIAIARALINQPVLLLADEPTGNLDSRTSDEILATFRYLHQRGMTLVLVTHDPAIAANAQRLIELRDGRIVRDEQAGGELALVHAPADSLESLNGAGVASQAREEEAL
jgi:putative ABC transport system ATP-binding protein